MRNIGRKYDWPQQIWMAKTLLGDRLITAVFSRLAAWQLRAHGCRRIGRGLKARGRIHVFTRYNGSIELGDRVLLVSRFRSNPVGITNPCVFDTVKGGRIQIGHDVGLSGTVLSSACSIKIGDFTKLGANVRVFDHNYHSLDWERRRDPRRDREDVRTAPVVIGRDVFVGTNAMILKGVAVGDRAVIAAGSVVTRDVPSGEIWGGNPAVALRRTETGTALKNGKKTGE